MAEPRFADTRRATSAGQLAGIIDDFTREGRGRIEQIRVSPRLLSKLRRSITFHHRYGHARTNTFMGIEVVEVHELGDWDVTIITERPPRTGAEIMVREMRTHYDALRAEHNDGLDALRYATAGLMNHRDLRQRVMAVFEDEDIPPPQAAPPQARGRTFGDIFQEWFRPGMEVVFNQRRARVETGTTQAVEQQCNEAWAEELNKLYVQDEENQKKLEQAAPATPERETMNPYPEQDTGPFTKTIVHLKRRDGWKQIKNYPGNGPLADIRAQLAMPERRRPMTVRELEAAPVAEETITRVTFHLVKSSVITDHRTGERVRETWYEED
jgi:hypothetical protein